LAFKFLVLKQVVFKERFLKRVFESKFKSGLKNNFTTVLKCCCFFANNKVLPDIISKHKSSTGERNIA